MSFLSPGGWAENLQPGHKYRLEADGLIDETEETFRADVNALLDYERSILPPACTDPACDPDGQVGPHAHIGWTENPHDY